MDNKNILFILLGFVILATIITLPFGFNGNRNYSCGMMNGFGMMNSYGFTGFLISTIIFGLFVALVVILIIKGMQMIGMFDNTKIAKEEIAKERNVRKKKK